MKAFAGGGYVGVVHMQVLKTELVSLPEGEAGDDDVPVASAAAVHSMLQSGSAFQTSLNAGPQRVLVPKSVARQLDVTATPAGELAATTHERAALPGSDDAPASDPAPHTEALVSDPTPSIEVLASNSSPSDETLASSSAPSEATRTSSSSPSEEAAALACSRDGDLVVAGKAVRGVRLEDFTTRRVAALQHHFDTRTTPDLPGVGNLHEAVMAPSRAAAAREETGDGAASALAVASPQAGQLLMAAEAADVDTVVQLLRQAAEKGGKVAATQLAQAKHAKHGGSPLHLVCAGPGDDEETVRCIQSLLEHGADVNALAGNGSTPLHWAAGAGNVAALRELLKQGGNPSQVTYTWRRQVFGKGSGQTALHWAAESGNMEAVELLLDAAVDTVSSPDEKGNTPMAVAAKEGHHAVEARLQDAAQEEYVCVQFSVEWTATRTVPIAPTR